MLRRLREGVKFSRHQPARDEKIAGALRCAFGENGRFDFDESRAVEVIAGRLGDPMAQPQVARELRPAQIEVAVGEAQVFVDLAIEREGEDLYTEVLATFTDANRFA